MQDATKDLDGRRGVFFANTEGRGRPDSPEGFGLSRFLKLPPHGIPQEPL